MYDIQQIRSKTGVVLLNDTDNENLRHMSNFDKGATNISNNCMCKSEESNAKCRKQYCY